MIHKHVIEMLKSIQKYRETTEEFLSNIESTLCNFEIIYPTKYRVSSDNLGKMFEILKNIENKNSASYIKLVNICSYLLKNNFCSEAQKYTLIQGFLKNKNACKFYKENNIEEELSKMFIPE